MDVRSEIDFEAVVQEVKKGLLFEAGAGFGVYADFAYHIGLAEDEDFSPEKRPELKEDFEHFLDDKVREVVDEEIYRIQYDVSPTEEYLRVFRAIVVPADWTVTDLGSRPLGVCWTWSEDFAIPYNGGGSAAEDKLVRLEGLVRCSDVNWNLTVALNAINSCGGEDEREIRIDANAQVVVDRVVTRAYHVDHGEVQELDLQAEEHPVAERALSLAF